MTKQVFEKEALERAHRHSIHHRDEIGRSHVCGCFDCLAIFAPSAITHWTDTARPEGEWTAFCPECAMDTVIGDASGFAIDKGFLKAMNRRWMG